MSPTWLWAHPRSRSTALERMMMERGDVTVLHEPLVTLLDDPLPGRVRGPAVLPDVELEQVDPVHAQVVQAAHGPVAHVLGREHLGQLVARPRRPLPVLRRHFRGRPQATVRCGPGRRPQGPAEQQLADPAPVRGGGVEERAAEPDRQVEAVRRRGQVGVDESAAAAGDPPHAVADLADPPAEPSHHPLAHASSSASASSRPA